MAWGVLTKDGRERVAGVLRALLITQLIISLVMVIFCYNASVKVMSLLKNIHKALMDELSSSLRTGIAHYLTEPKWKKLMDTMQVELSCCGVEHPSDWHQIPWINMDFLNEDSELVMKLSGVDGKVILPVSPYSCCSPYVLTPCYHDPLQQRSRESPHASLHARACLDAVRAPLARVTHALYFFNVLVLLLQVVIVILTQVVRSSALQAVARGDWTEHLHVPEQMVSNVNVNIDARALSLRHRARRSYHYLS